MRTSESLTKIAPDLVKAIGSLKGAAKSAENGHFNSKYATLESVIEASRDVLLENSICAIQAPGEVHEKVLIVTTRLLHTSGEWIESDFHMPLTRWSPHEAGSALTYARRYALMAALNLAPLDDDGNAASGVGAPKETFVTPAQVKELEKLIEETDTQLDLILKYAKVAALSEIPASEFASLRTKLAAKKKEAS